jgi:Fe-S-cluster containining protein
MSDSVVEACVREVSRLANQALERGRRSEEELARLMTAVEARVQAVLLSERPELEVPPACAHGCAGCCTVNVATLPLEGVAAAAWLRRRTGPESLEARAGSLLRFHGEARWLEDGERIRARVRCPFLDGPGGCTIYPVRPLACRALSSLDAGECRQALQERGEGDGPGLVRMNLQQKALYDGAFVALSEALVRHGLDARCRDVSGMAGYFLADPARAEAWAAGVPIAIE